MCYRPPSVRADLTRVLALLAFLIPYTCVRAQDVRSGQGSPVHDSDRRLRLGKGRVHLENDQVELEFDTKTGALTEFDFKVTHWSVIPDPSLAQSFTLFAPMPDRSYSPVLGSRNDVTSISKTGSTVHIRWENMHSENRGVLPITMDATVTLTGNQVTFDASIVNHSDVQVASAEWPICGALAPPSPQDTLTRQQTIYASLSSTPMYPKFSDERGSYGTNYPTEISTNFGYQNWVLLAARDQGLYFGTHETNAEELVQYFGELKPGYESVYVATDGETASLSGHPNRISFGAVHFPFLNPGETRSLSKIVIAPYRGDWHSGVDIYKAWKATWFARPPLPKWADQVHSWQQLQINSSEDDLRTPYKDLPARAHQAAENGIAAIQLVGWNDGGQDRGNPSHDTDPRLGTFDDLKKAIADIQKTGVHVILFNKYTWADITTDWYKRELIQYMAEDPFGVPYQHGGYQYQTPEQLSGINTRRFSPACTNDQRWLDLAAAEFEKTLDLGAAGMLYDEVIHHGGASYCFSSQHGHHTPASLFAGDLRLAKRFRDMVQASVGEQNFLFAGEAPYDLEKQFYSLSYFRVSDGHIPADRYANPFVPMMVAVEGFDDREMINRALLDRYVLSYEPFRFKGDLRDFPLSLAYGKSVDALRTRYSEYVWTAEFRDTVGAQVLADGKPFKNYSVFRQTSGKRAVVMVNDNHDTAVAVSIKLDGGTAGSLTCVTPEFPDGRSCGERPTIAPRSALVALEP